MFIIHEIQMKKILLGMMILALAFGMVGIANAYTPPSTNDINRTNGWAHVDLVSAGVGEVTLNFISARAFYSCFEYRTDGDTSQASGDNYNTDITDGLYPYYCQNNNSRTQTIHANGYVEVRMVFGAEDDERFDWTRFDVVFARSAEITSPTAGEEVYGTVSFDAALTDKDGNDSVQWAVRKGTCAAGTGTIIGNVDGHSDSYTWNGAAFHAEADTSLWPLGNYCFVFNPSESVGDVAIRETREFKIVNSDVDGDGVLNNDDLCPGTAADDFPQWLGSQGRYGWDGHNWISSGKGAKSFVPTIEDTYGCSGIQILDRMKNATGLSFDGHYKFGLSKGLIKDWISGTYHVGLTPVETLEVPAASDTPVTSAATLDLGKDYFLKARGTATACWQPGCEITLDAEYSTSNGGGTWDDGVAAPYDTYGADLLDLKVDGNFVSWGAYNSAHEYQIPYAGTGSTLSAVVNDLSGSYFNNGGSLFIDIIEDKWVPLW